MKSNDITNSKAFTLIEVVIVIIVIFGLLAAMAIPAFMKVRESALVKAHQRGEKLDAEQMNTVREYYRRTKTHRENPQEIVVQPENSPILIPYDQITEVTINGQKFYAWTKK